MRIYVDFDDVVAETARGLAERLLAWRGSAPEYEDIKAFDLHVSFGLNDEEYRVFMEAAHTREALLAYEEMPDASATLRAWLDDGLEPVIATGRPVCSAAASREWLDARGLPDLPLLHVDKYNRSLGAPDPSVRVVPFSDLSSEGFSLAVDDAPPALELLEKSRLCPYVVFDRPWNRSWTGGAARVRTWAELDRFVRGFAG